MNIAAVVIEHLQESWIDDQTRHNGPFIAKGNAPSASNNTLAPQQKYYSTSKSVANTNP
jgi:hypothetical protein